MFNLLWFSNKETMKISNWTAFGIVANLVCLGIAVKYHIYESLLLGLTGLAASGILLIHDQKGRNK